MLTTAERKTTTADQIMDLQAPYLRPAATAVESDFGFKTLEVSDLAYYQEVVEAAIEMGADAVDSLHQALWRLTNDMNPGFKTQCRLVKDYAPFSFGFGLNADRGLGWEPWYCGGLIYSGPGQPLDGSGPAFCVSLEPTGDAHRWSIHT